jgi:acetoin utilization deacetylase AcuC-like enzyme
LLARPADDATPPQQHHGTAGVDPISFFRLQSADFFTYGRMIGACAIPTLFVLEGGYAVGAIGINVVNVLTGFEEASSSIGPG